MNRYLPVRTKMDSEDHYNSPYDTHELESDAHYEAPSCLKRNPSGSLFIPSGPGDNSSSQGESTLPLDGRLRYTPYSPHHTLSSNVYNVGSLGTRLGNTLLSRGGVSGAGVVGGSGAGSNSPARSPNGEFKNVDPNRCTLPTAQGSTGHLTGVYHPSTHPLHNGSTGGKVTSQHSSNSNFRMKSDLSSRCSWKFVSIFFMLFSFLLVSALIYTAASNFVMNGAGSLDTAKACAIVEDETFPTDNINKDLTKSDGPMDVLRGEGSFRPPDPNSFQNLPFGAKIAHVIPAYSFLNFQFQQSESAYVSFAFLIPRGSSIGLYARKNAIPSLTNNDLRDVLQGYRASQSGYKDKRGLSSVEKQTSYYMDSGHWFISLYNDDSEPRQLEMTASISADLTSACPRGCSGRGECILGQCQCSSGFTGPDCSHSTCPVLCSGNGEYVEGSCRCFPGWKGTECSIRHNECEVPDCNNHGTCFNGECVCSRGYTGQFCDKVDCLDPSCSGQGVCVAGTCVCNRGWEGPTCSIREKPGAGPNVMCPALTGNGQLCSGRGNYEPAVGRCNCHAGFAGPDCSKELCHLDCGPHGVCEDGGCSCEAGWRGSKCEVRTCDPRCSAHGMCSNGTCLCTNGWNGKHCTLEGCPGDCNGHGTCTTTYQSSWECLCETGWYGVGCQIQLEQDCDDKQDNDRDGLIDCEDPECCESPVCERSQLCHTVSAPIDILLRKQPPAITASFYERMRFIIEDKGLQSYAKKEGFNESRAAVVRGQVVTPTGMGLIGVRVSTNGANEGFTMTRDDGWFDLMVNGGGPVMLQFGRNPYSPLRLSLYVPWNEVVVLNPVKLTKEEVHVQVPAIYGPIASCPAHDYYTMRPLTLSTWHGAGRRAGGAGLRSTILAESQVLQEVLDIPGTNIHLVYHSSRAKGFFSTIQLQLTPATVPSTLVRVHLSVSVEGNLEEKVFEADPNLKYVFAWDRQNVYRQRVYGLTTANIKVGYEYRGCEMVWHVQTARLAGHDMTLADIGGWNLDIHHKYNFHEGILQKGDGTNLYLKYNQPLAITTVLGNGNARSLDSGGRLVCGPPAANACNGPSGTALPVLAVKSVAAAPDGSLYVADHDLIRRIKPDGSVVSILLLNSTRVSYRYHLAHRTYTGELEQRQTLYVSLPDLYKVIKVNSIEHPTPIDRNWMDAIGTGERCLPGDPGQCGDGGKAEHAKLFYPKGIAIGPEGRIYIADGPNIRYVDETGVIHSLAGTTNHRASWKPLPCGGGPMAALPLHEVQLNWPTDLALDPLDGSLHFIDDNLVLKVTKDRRVQIVAGQPIQCTSTHHPAAAGVSSPVSLFSPLTLALTDPQSLAFSPRGDLYIAESDSQRVNRVRRISRSNNRLETIAGRTSNCNCLDRNSAGNGGGCRCFDPDAHLAANTRFSAISSIAVTPDGTLYVADQGNYRVRAVANRMPTNDDVDGDVFEVPDPDTQEVYVFNKFGQHVLTRDLLTRATVYRMEYHQSTSNGKLVSVTDVTGRKLSLIRDYSHQVTALQTADGRKHVVRINNKSGNLEGFDRADGYRVEFRYVASSGSSGLLLSRLDNQNYGYMFQYDVYGRLLRAVYPTGEVVSLQFNLTEEGVGTVVVNNELALRATENSVSQMVRLPSDLDYTIDFNGQLYGESGSGNENSLTGFTSGLQPEREIIVRADKSVEVVQGELKMTLATISHPVIRHADPVIGDSYPMVGELMVEASSNNNNNNNLLCKAEWEYGLQASGTENQQLIGISKKLRVNGENALIVSYDNIQKREMLKLPDKTDLLEIKYDDNGRPVSYVPSGGTWAVVAQNYDRFGHLISWQWGEIREQYNYDKEGRLASVQRGNATRLVYDYADGRDVMPARITTGRGSSYILRYDDSNGVGLGRLGSASGAAGGNSSLASITTPRGHIHSWYVKPDIGSLGWHYLAPWSQTPYVVVFNAKGQVERVRHPGGEQAIYVYSTTGRLVNIFSGQTDIEFNNNNSGQDGGGDGGNGGGSGGSAGQDRSGNGGASIESTFVSQKSFELREKRKYHNGWLKQQQIRCNGVPGIDNANIRYQMDGTGRPTKVTASFGRKEAPSQMWAYHQVLGNLVMTDNYKVRQTGFNTSEIFDMGVSGHSNGGNYRKTIEMNAHGSVKKLIYTVLRRAVFTLELDYNPENLVDIATSLDPDGRTSRTRYNYNADDQLERATTAGGQGGGVSYSYKHDDNGNVVGVNVAGGATRTNNGGHAAVISYGPGDRVEKHGARKIEYDANGFVTKIGENRFLFNGLGQLVESLSMDGGLKAYYFYDQYGRLAAWSDIRGSVTQYFYTDPLAPDRVTYVHMPRNDVTQKLTYDHLGHLIQIETADQVLYVACDHQGSPVMVFQSNGKLVKRLRYSPYGEVIEDSQPNFLLPLGFMGAINLGQSRSGGDAGSFLCLRGRIYDPDIGQWLSPDWRRWLERPVVSPLDIFVYRFMGNNPVNVVRGEGGGSAWPLTLSRDAKGAYMTSMNEWARLFGFDADRIFLSVSNTAAINMLTSSATRMDKQPMVSGCCSSNLNSFYQLPADSRLLARHEVVSELDNYVRVAMDSLKDLRFIRHEEEAASDYSRRRVPFMSHLASRPQNLGQGLLLSVIEDQRAVVNPVEVANSVVQKIFESVLNNSIYLDVSYSEPAARTVYYFVKPNMNQFPVDSDTTRRLSGEFTVSNTDMDAKSLLLSGGGAAKQLSIVNSRFEVHILYGAPAAAFRGEILRTSMAKSIAGAWAREKDLVSRGFSSNWSPSEAAELVRTGSVHGYEPVEVQPVDRYPGLLVADASNYEFLKTASNSGRRKNRHGRRKQHPGD